MCSEPFHIYIHGIQWDFMQRSCWKHSGFENRCIRYINLAPDLRNRQKKTNNDSLNRHLLNFDEVWYIKGGTWSILMSRRFRICIAKGGRESLRPLNIHILNATWWILMSRRFRICMAKGGRESARPSYGRPKLTLILREKNCLRRCSKKLGGHNFDFRAKSSWEKSFNIYKNFLSGGFRSKVKIAAG